MKQRCTTTRRQCRKFRHQQLTFLHLAHWYTIHTHARIYAFSQKILALMLLFRTRFSLYLISFRFLLCLSFLHFLSYTFLCLYGIISSYFSLVSFLSFEHRYSISFSQLIISYHVTRRTIFRLRFFHVNNNSKSTILNLEHCTFLSITSIFTWIKSNIEDKFILINEK